MPTYKMRDYKIKHDNRNNPFPLKLNYRYISIQCFVHFFEFRILRPIIVDSVLIQVIQMQRLKNEGV
jgi:hypothetical protein